MKTNTASRETLGLTLGLLGVISFSLTLPATRVAVAYFDPALVAFGRSVVASVFAAGLLWATRQPLPTRDQVKSLAVVAAGVIVGFPLLSAVAMRTLPASHGAVVIAIIPLFTAILGALRLKERPSVGFWAASVAGSGAVLAFAGISGSGDPRLADLALLGAALAAGFGYAEGGKLARAMGGWQVICWALVLAAPMLAAPVAVLAWHHGIAAPLRAWEAFAYVALVSQFLGFFLWYQGLALGGVVRVSQVQLLQPFFTMAASAWLLGEQITQAMVWFAAIVAGAVAIGRKMPVTGGT